MCLNIKSQTHKGHKRLIAEDAKVSANSRMYLDPRDLNLTILRPSRPHDKLAIFITNSGTNHTVVEYV